MSDAARPSRRTVLLAALAVPLAACRPKRRGEAARVPTPSRDAQALSDALAAERSLLADYDSAVSAAASAGGMPYALFRATHVAHVQALESALNASSAAPTTSAPTSSAPSAAALRAREAATGRVLTDAAVAAHEGAVAALLASIAASHLAQSHMRFHHGGGPQ